MDTVGGSLSCLSIREMSNLSLNLLYCYAYTYVRVFHAECTLLWTCKLLSKIGILRMCICKVEYPQEHVS